MGEKQEGSGSADGKRLAAAGLGVDTWQLYRSRLTALPFAHSLLNFRIAVGE